MSKGIKFIKEYRCPCWDEFPDIDLYMDQVLTFLNQHLEPICILNNEKKLTASMINNYVKHGIVEKPLKKKYNKTHLVYLYVVCLLKKIYSMDEIFSLIKIQVKTSDIESAYATFCNQMEDSIQRLFESNKREMIVTEASEPVRLMQETIQSVVSSLYVQALLFDKSE